jgi:ribose transport system substrate-binding protein
VIITGIGKIRPVLASLIEDKLIHGYVSINFYDMGAKSYQAMKALVTSSPLPTLSPGQNKIYIIGEQQPDHP